MWCRHPCLPPLNKDGSTCPSAGTDACTTKWIPPQAGYTSGGRIVAHDSHPSHDSHNAQAGMPAPQHPARGNINIRRLGVRIGLGPVRARGNGHFHRFTDSPIRGLPPRMLSRFSRRGQPPLIGSAWASSSRAPSPSGHLIFTRDPFFHAKPLLEMPLAGAQEAPRHPQRFRGHVDGLSAPWPEQASQGCGDRLDRSRKQRLGNSGQLARRRRSRERGYRHFY